mgnify:CR=1 FL=1
MSGGATHQGIVAFAAAKDYSTVDDILKYAESRGEAPFVVVLDEVEDPHNLGAIIRTAECAGVHGIIIPKRRSAGLSYTVAKASAGAIEYMRVARVTNIAVTLDELKEKACGFTAQIWTARIMMSVIFRVRVQLLSATKVRAFPDLSVKSAM